MDKPNSDQQIQQLYLNPKYQGVKQLFNKAILTDLKFRKTPNLANKLIFAVEKAALSKKLDSEIYKEIHDLVHNVLFKSTEYQKDEFSREKNRTDQLKPIFNKIIKNKIISYLDLGCNEGKITNAVGKLLNAPIIRGCDVIKTQNEYEFEFTLLNPNDPYTLPYENASQNVVTAFMSLHHIEQINKTLNEIHRVLKPNGIFLIREHDCSPPELELLLDLMHGFYAMVWSNPPEMNDFKTHFSHYYTKINLLNLIEKNGFKLIYQDQPRGAWRYYYAAFRKI